MTIDAHSPARSAARMSPSAREHGRNFLASLFMAVRTAQIHDPSNQAFDNAMQAVSKAAITLYQATGGFSVRFVDDVVFLNGVRLRFDGGNYSWAQTLRQMLAGKGLGGLELYKPPSQAAVRKLVMMFAPEAHEDDHAGTEALVGDIRVLGIQRFQDQPSDVRIDRKVMVVQSYGKLILALRERLERIQLRQELSSDEPLGPPRLKPVRVVQDLIELCNDRSDFLLRLATNRQGAPLIELFGVNASLLSLVMGRTIGIPRQELVDVGLAALFVPLGFDPGGVADPRTATLTAHNAHAAVVRLLTDSGIGPSTYLRTVVLGEQCGLTPVETGSPPHPYAKMVRCACAYEQLVLGLGIESPLHPLAALARLHNDRSLDLDRRWVDLLVNVLRAFPKGAEVVLDDGSLAVVLSQMGGTRWDRPMVRVAGPPAATHDLMIQEDDRFLRRIRGTAFYLGLSTEPPEYLEEESPTDDVTFDDLPAEALLSPDALAELASQSDGADLLQQPLLGPNDFGLPDVRTDVDLYPVDDETDHGPTQEVESPTTWED